MGRASSNKKVNRAAGTGGGRTARGRRPVVWYSTLFLVATAGVLLVFSSAKDLRDVAADDTAPRVGKDHWHAAYGVFLCDTWVAPLPDAARDRDGLHTHNDGLMHTEPAVPSAAGKNATFGKFLEEMEAKITETSISVPKATKATRLSVKNGDKCGKDKGSVKTVVFKNKADTKGRELEGSPLDWKIADGQIIAVGFVSEGTVLQPPPSAPNLPEPGGDAGSNPPPMPPPGSPPPSDSPSPSDSPPPASTPPASPAPESSPTTAK